MRPKRKQEIEIEKTHRNPLTSFHQALTQNWLDFLGTALISGLNFPTRCFWVWFSLTCESQVERPLPVGEDSRCGSGLRESSSQGRGILACDLPSAAGISAETASESKGDRERDALVEATLRLA
jgi:hypothetical protein